MRKTVNCQTAHTKSIPHSLLDDLKLDGPVLIDVNEYRKTSQQIYLAVILAVIFLRNTCHT